MRFFVCLSSCFAFLIIGTSASAQLVKPGVPGMAGSRWISVKTSQAPGRTYRFDNQSTKSYTQEDIFFKMYLPVIHKQRFGIITGLQYRTEQLEFDDHGENPIHQLSNWNLRSWGLELKSYKVLDSATVLVAGIQANQSASIDHHPYKNVPVNYTLTTAVIRKLSPTKEIGGGVIVGKGFDRLTILPVFIYNNTYSTKRGIEISLPYKIAWRHNLTPSDIVYLKAEGSTRSYYCNDVDVQSGTFRRTDLDMGIWYNRKITSLVGMEAYGGYKINVSNNLPDRITPVKTSGLAFSLEIYVRVPSARR